MSRRSKSLPFLTFIIGFGVGYFWSEPQSLKAPAVPSSNSEIHVCFSPHGNCEKQVIDAIHSAKEQILVQAYSFTSPAIAQALIDAHHQNIEVKILYDHSQFKTPHSRIPEMQKAGIPAKVDQTAGLAHNKVMIIDQSLIITGSFNWTRAANHKNSENLLLIYDQSLARLYEDNWIKRNQD